MHKESDSQFDPSSETSRAIMGEPPAWFVNSLDAIVPGFSRLIIKTDFGTVYHGSGLNLKTRELVLLASCGSLGTTGIGALKKRIPTALMAGASRMEILEVLVQIGLGAGLPTSIGALQAAADVFTEIDAAGVA